MDRNYYPVMGMVEDQRDDMPELVVELPAMMDGLLPKDRVAISIAFSEMVAAALNNSPEMGKAARKKIRAMFSDAAKRAGGQ